jgi:hypothetical protein
LLKQDLGFKELQFRRAPYIVAAPPASSPRQSKRIGIFAVAKSGPGKRVGRDRRFGVAMAARTQQ